MLQRYRSVSHGARGPTQAGLGVLVFLLRADWRLLTRATHEGILGDKGVTREGQDGARWLTC